jgi:Ricin-type beta-trefoil lectin domain
MPRHFWKLLAAVALAPGLALAGAGAARADVVPPAGTWAEIFAPEVNANGITLCIDDPAGSTAQFQALQLWRCHGYASNGIPQRWTFYYAGSNSLGPAYRIANTGGSNWCIGLTPHPSSYAAWYGTSLVQEACSSTTGSEVVWNLVPATQSPDPDNQFMLTSTYVPFGQQPYCISASSWTDENGTRLVAKPCDPSDSRQFWALG